MNAAENSFHELTNTKTIAVTMPGHTSGSEILNIVWSRPSPSMRAASSISLGTEAKKACMIQMANDRPTARTVGCSICVHSTRRRNTMRPGKRNLAT